MGEQLHQRQGSRLEIAAICLDTGALGPGRRSAVWVQGCELTCRGCIAPDWIPRVPARSYCSTELAELLLRPARVTGLTFSGGEPMLQAAGLAEVARTARQCRDVSVVCFTGYTLERLRSRPPAPAIDELLAEVDVLVDGPYVAERDTGVGMRGSDNQRVHYLTGRIRPADHDFEGVSRAVEIRVTSDDESAQVLLVGVPPHGLRERLDVVQQRVLDLVGGAA